jgi:hypothetical protein
LVNGYEVTKEQFKKEISKTEDFLLDLLQVILLIEKQGAILHLVSMSFMNTHYNSSPPSTNTVALLLSTSTNPLCIENKE